MVNARRVLSRVGLLGLTIVIGTIAIAISSTGAASNDRDVVDGYRESGQARIGSVGRQSITEADYAEKLQAVETNLAYMRGEVQRGSPNSAYLEQFISMIERHGVDNVALAALVQDLALYQHALDQGYAASPEEIAARVEQDRELVAAESAPKIEAYIDAVGADRYWSELYPRIAERDIVTQAMWQALTDGLNDQTERDAVWQTTEQQAVESVAVDWTDAAGAADLSSALAYLDEYRDLR